MQKTNSSPHVSPCNSDSKEINDNKDIESMDNDTSAPENDLLFGLEDEGEEE